MSAGELALLRAGHCLVWTWHPRYPIILMWLAYSGPMTSIWLRPYT